MILNIHGLNGSAHNTNYYLLEEYYGKDKIISPQIDYLAISPNELLEQLRQYQDIEYIVGTSFGGFFTHILSEEMNVPCILANPCIPPERYIPNIEKDYQYVEELKQLSEKYQDYHVDTYMILGMQDELLSPSYSEQVVKAKKIWKIDGKHSFSGNNKFRQVFLEAIQEIEVK